MEIDGRILTFKRVIGSKDSRDYDDLTPKFIITNYPKAQIFFLELYKSLVNIRQPTVIVVKVMIDNVPYLAYGKAIRPVENHSASRGVELEVYFSTVADAKKHKHVLEFFYSNLQFKRDIDTLPLWSNVHFVKTGPQSISTVSEKIIASINKNSYFDDGRTFSSLESAVSTVIDVLNNLRNRWDDLNIIIGDCPSEFLDLYQPKLCLKTDFTYIKPSHSLPASVSPADNFSFEKELNSYIDRYKKMLVDKPLPHPSDQNWALFHFTDMSAGLSLIEEYPKMRAQTLESIKRQALVLSAHLKELGRGDLGFYISKDIFEKISDEHLPDTNGYSQIKHLFYKNRIMIFLIIGVIIVVTFVVIIINSTSVNPKVDHKDDIIQATPSPKPNNPPEFKQALLIRNDSYVLIKKIKTLLIEMNDMGWEDPSNIIKEKKERLKSSLIEIEKSTRLFQEKLEVYNKSADNEKASIFESILYDKAIIEKDLIELNSRKSDLEKSLKPKRKK